ncbi:H/ACA ribonucleoprotein complex subunit GAR1 [Stetteria hydrogenophila]
MLELQGGRARRRQRREPRRPVEYRRIPLGRLMHRVPTGHLVARMEPMERLPSLGAKVVDGSGREVGVLADIIGPVASPFAVIKPSGEVRDLSEGAELYALVAVKRHSGKPGPRGGGRRRGRGRGRGREGQRRR